MIKLLAGLLLAIGILLMTGSGLCSLYVIIGAGPSSHWTIIWFALVFGGLPFALGGGLFAVGLRLLKKQRRISLDELDDRFR
jgi:hypothetical protein